YPATSRLSGHQAEQATFDPESAGTQVTGPLAVRRILQHALAEGQGFAHRLIEVNRTDDVLVEVGPQDIDHILAQRAGLIHLIDDETVILKSRSANAIAFHQ